MSDLTLTPDSLEHSGIADTKPTGSLLARVLFAVPVLGWFLKDAAKGGDSAKYFFIFNALVLWIGAIAIFGYPAFIIIELFMVFLAFCWVIAVCR